MKVILSRIGSKSQIASKIIPYFPAHDLYIEPFFGAGGMFFNKPKAKYNIVNDLDSDVFNLFMMVLNRRDELEQAFKLMPIHSDLLKYWKTHEEVDPIKKAIRFVLMSNFTHRGGASSICFEMGNTKQNLLSELDFTIKKLENVRFNNTDFKKFFNAMHIQNDSGIERTFVYADPPYIGTSDTYSDSFTEQDSIDLFDALEAFGSKYAMSEFDNPFILEQAKARGLNVITIGERCNLKNRRTEILITNYETNSLFNMGQ